jgi:nucleoside-diphosphate-sugar epimerase
LIILYKKHFDANVSKSSIVLIFGVGLIGSHIVKDLLLESYILLDKIAYSWFYEENRASEKIQIINSVKRNYIDTLNGNDFKIDVLWSAGKGGFGMTESDVSMELRSFVDMLDIAQLLQSTFSSSQIRVHLISSAGGLYEGQRNVGVDSVPDLKRPYAKLKIQQENLLSSFTELIKFIYRPSSVYGYAGIYSRLGLIPTLLLNGAKNQGSVIFGSPDTLRDYVWVNDVSNFVAKNILSSEAVSQSYILASGKPTSLLEISVRVQHFLNKKIFLRFVKEGVNSAHNTFSPNTYPHSWNPMDIETGIRKTGLLLFSS